MLLEVKNISYRYSKSSKWILKDVSFTVDSKERVALVGPSGYGKSTLSKIISGYIKPDKGEVLWDGKATPEKCYCPIQMIYQHPLSAISLKLFKVSIASSKFNPGVGSSAIINFASFITAVAIKTRLAIPPDN